MTAQNKTQIFKLTHMHKYPPPPPFQIRTENWDKHTRRVQCYALGDILKACWDAVYSFWHMENTRETFIEALSYANKLIHPLSASLSSLNNIHTQRHTRWLRVLRAFRATWTWHCSESQLWCGGCFLFWSVREVWELCSLMSEPDQAGATAACPVCPPSSSGTSALLSPSPELNGDR